MERQITPTLIEDSTNRSLILNMISSSPGLGYMELKRLTGLSYGTLTYHLTRLERAGRIMVIRTSRRSRYYPAGMSDVEAYVIHCMRSRTCRDVLLMMMRYGGITLSMATKMLGRPKTVIKYHLDRLVGIGIVKGERIGRYMLYHIKESVTVYVMNASRSMGAA